MPGILSAALMILALGAPAPAAPARVPDLTLSHFPTVLTLSPDGELTYSARVVYPNGNSYAGDSVEIEFSPQAEAMISWAPGQEHPIVSGYTDAGGGVEFQIRGGGCVRPEDVPGAPYVARVRVNNIVVSTLTVNSPDAVNAAGLLPSQSGGSTCDDGAFGVSLADATYHGDAIRNGRAEICSKFTEPYDAEVGLGDAAILSVYIKRGASASCR